ncbi:MAG: hypothetical protein JSS47_11190 [Proteobacteria bacterium]|nr:hypothetical protein [Pseudomonadota bacterium]
MSYKSKLNPKNIKNNYVPWNRNWVVVRRHLPIVLKPLFAGIVLALFWRLILYKDGVHFGVHSSDPILHLILPLIGFMYIIFAGVAVTSVFDQYKIISKCVVKKDMETFLLYRDEQLPIMMHILVSVPSILIIAFVMLFNYQGDTLIGVSSVFSVSFALLLVWVIATELDDFSKSIWFREKIPKEWYEVDIEEHFREKGKAVRTR